jgi:sulfoxide reductase heme-binding subunit YedZ
MNRNNLRKRLVHHHLPLALAGAGCCLFVFALAKSKYLPFRLSMATAYTGALLLGTTLVIGVLKVLRGETTPVSTNLRRDVGIWAAFFGLAHVVIGLQVHAPGRMLTYFFYPREQVRLCPLRLDSAGWANHLGLLAGLLLIMLLLLSNDRSLKLLGVQRWKSLQRMNYIVFGLVLIHGVLYQALEKRIVGWVITFAALSLVVIALQLAEFRKRRMRKRSSATQ